MNPHRLGDVATITARDGDRDGQANLATEIDYEGVASREALGRKAEPAERVISVRIGARQI